jgi:hypothetical protein
MSAPHVYTAIVGVMAALAGTGIQKGRKNTQQNYAFRGVDDVYNALAPVLSANKLAILPRVLSRSCEERQTKSGGTMFYVVVDVEFVLVSAEDGSTHVVRFVGEAMDTADKATNKAMSAAYKYAAFQTFCIPTEADNDADAHTPAPAPREHDPSWDADRERFCAALNSIGLRYDNVRDWHVVKFGVKPSQLPSNRRRELLGYLQGDGKRDVTAWLARGAADAK